MEKYKKHIEGNDKVEMIHVSLDKSEDAAEEWAAKEEFPWPTILNDKVERSGFNDYKKTGFVPEYHLVDASGKTLVEPSSSGSAVFAKIAELTGEDSE